jgi:hypothetical protein
MRVAILGGGHIDILGLPHERTDPEGFSAGFDGSSDAGDDLVEAVERHGAGVDRLPAGRLFREPRNIHVAEIGEDQRARDRRGGHDENVGRRSLGRQRQPLMHAETVLLVHHDKPEPAEFDAGLEERVRADDDAGLAGGHTLARASRFRSGVLSG